MSRWLRPKRYAISAFIAFHMIAIACWAIPINGSLITACRSALRPYFVWSGLFQSWDMFSPIPKRANVYMEAVIIREDGSTQLWTFPRMDLLSLTGRYFKERYRKYEETLDNDTFALLWPDAARHIARMERGNGSPPQSVMLVVRSSRIIPRSDGGYDRGPWNATVLYKYDVQPEDLP